LRTSTRLVVVAGIALVTALPVGSAAAEPPVPAAALRHVAVHAADVAVRPLVGTGGVWAVEDASPVTFVQRIDPRSNRPLGPPITLPPRVTSVEIDARGIFVTRYVDGTFDSPLERVRLARATGTQIGPAEPLQTGPEDILLFARPVGGGWSIEIQNDEPKAPVAVRFNHVGAEVVRVPIFGRLTSDAVDHRGSLWIGGYQGASLIRRDGRRTVLKETGARWPAVAVDRHAAWLVGHSGTKRAGVSTFTKRLYRLDLATGRRVGKPLVLGGITMVGPPRFELVRNTIEVGRGSAWIEGPMPGTLTRVYLPRR
jgi:hypothetical protein